MSFHPIDLDTWPRKEYFDHYFSQVPCSYTITSDLDITLLRRYHYRLYPTMLYFLAQKVNAHPEFRTGFNQEGVLGVFDHMDPSYTIFHPSTETFSNIWTEYTSDYAEFCRRYDSDQKNYGMVEQFQAKPGEPEHVFPVSMIPWVTFSSFELHLPQGNRYLFPIFTMGKFVEQNGSVLLPISIRVHHAVCDGFHTARFLNELQETLSQINPERFPL